ncbi:MAG: magnesium/cobalt transporter CorA [Candidatus Caldatribacteriota bacterium]|nr:magnesium/cobalt transporter CorA [Atribacterota bacterium]MDD3640630.1 magnesium/cobalt transporter CorA [Atribacterota bacterium]MDD4288904.1 magnesium/cobalt transporter CorA [Atribacterota bacterium]MDD4765658.1 magnesium/cobalt transporter CorA [Atribacterota bacterium]MDI9597098.1 magnesium/cobalt transporter CorA [Atribacterota bacterium]
MAKFLKKRGKSIGLTPGTPVHIGERFLEKPKISIIDYSPEYLEEKTVDGIEKCIPYLEKPTITWINIDGIHQTDIIEQIGQSFKIHPLTLENIMNTAQRPKIEYFSNYIYIALKMIYWDNDKQELSIEHISLILTDHTVISFQEKEGDVFNPVRQRIKNEAGKIRKSDSDYLLYSLLDSVVDQYFLVLEKVGDKLELLEDILIAHPSPDNQQTIHQIKRNLIFLRNAVWPLREVINKLEKDESDLVHKNTKLFLRDIYDHTIQIIETTETLRDMISGLLDIYLSSVSNRMNEVMKVLTIIATIFIPLTFVAGIYGMNFKHMPELSWKWGYPTILSVMFLIGLGMFFFFKKKKWL